MPSTERPLLLSSCPRSVASLATDHAILRAQANALLPVANPISTSMPGTEGSCNASTSGCSTCGFHGHDPSFAHCRLNVRSVDHLGKLKIDDSGVCSLFSSWRGLTGMEDWWLYALEDYLMCSSQGPYIWMASADYGNAPLWVYGHYGKGIKKHACYYQFGCFYCGAMTGKLYPADWDEQSAALSKQLMIKFFEPYIRVVCQQRPLPRELRPQCQGPKAPAMPPPQAAQHVASMVTIQASLTVGSTFDQWTTWENSRSTTAVCAVCSAHGGVLLVWRIGGCTHSRTTSCVPHRAHTFGWPARTMEMRHCGSMDIMVRGSRSMPAITSSAVSTVGR